MWLIIFVCFFSKPTVKKECIVGFQLNITYCAISRNPTYYFQLYVFYIFSIQFLEFAIYCCSCNLGKPQQNSKLFCTNKHIVFFFWFRYNWSSPNLLRCLFIVYLFVLYIDFNWINSFNFFSSLLSIILSIFSSLWGNRSIEHLGNGMSQNISSLGYPCHYGQFWK